MAAQFGVVAKGLDGLKDNLQRVLPFLRAAQKNTATRLSLLMETRLTRAASGELLNVRSDTYRSSIGSSAAEVDGGTTQVRTGIRSGAASKYALIQEDGGTIRPKGHPLLSIPVGDALNASGVARYASPLDVPGDTMWIFPKGRKPLFVEKDENDDINVLFVGVPEVTLKAKQPVEKSYDDVSPLAPQIGQEELDRAIELAFAGG